MQNDVFKSLQESVEEVKNLLSMNPNWREKFNEHINAIVKKENEAFHKNAQKNYRIKASNGLFAYSSISLLKTSTKKCRYYDFRYIGQSVAKIKLQKENNYINAYICTTKKQDNRNKKYFHVDQTIPQWSDWDSSCAKKFRSKFKKCTYRGKSPEHAMENMLLYEFSKKKSIDKQLCNIQPVQLDRQFFQMVTPFGASTDKLKYNASHKGGGIDIMARIKTKQNENRLVIFELKDENKSQEPPQKVIKQAVTYATFVGCLLADKTQSEKWWKLFEFNSKPDKIKLIASTLMPLSDKYDNQFGCEGSVLKVTDDIEIEVHSLFYDEMNKKFEGSLKEIMMESYANNYS